MSKIQACQSIVDNSQRAKIDGVMVDSFTASAIVLVHKNLNEASRAKFEGFPIERMASIAMKLVK